MGGRGSMRSLKRCGGGLRAGLYRIWRRDDLLESFAVLRVCLFFLGVSMATLGFEF